MGNGPRRKRENKYFTRGEEGRGKTTEVEGAVLLGRCLQRKGKKQETQWEKNWRRGEDRPNLS